MRDKGLEAACWDDVFREVNRITPFIAQTAPPFLYFSGPSFADVRALALRLSARIGKGNHRSAAQLAAVRSAEGNVIQLRPRRWAAFLRRFGVEHLAELNFPEELLEQLRLFGLATLGDVQRLTQKQLGAQFGPDGQRLYAMLHPASEDRVPLYAPPAFIEEWYEFDEPVVTEPGILEPVVRECIEKAGRLLGPYQCQRIRLGLQIVGEKEPRWEGRVLSIPRNRTDTLFRLTVPLLQDILLKLYTAAGGIGNVDSLGIRLESLRTPSSTQAPLFDERPTVLNAVRGVHGRYPGMMQRAVMHEHVLFEEDEMTFESAGDEATPG